MPISYDEYDLIATRIKPIVKSQAIQRQLSDIREEIVSLSNEVSFRQRKEITATLNNIDADDAVYEKHFDEIRQTIITILKEQIPNAIV